MPKGPKPRPLIERLLDKVLPEPNTGCWLFTGCWDKKNYGKIGGRFREGKLLTATRVSYEYFKGSFDKNLFVLHKCDTPPCVNPDHLFLGTQFDNIQDCIRKGRFIVGEKHKNHTLSEKIVLDILSLFTAGHRQTEISKKTGVSRPMVCRIIKGKSWAHVNVVRHSGDLRGLENTRRRKFVGIS